MQGHDAQADREMLAVMMGLHGSLAAFWIHAYMRLAVPHSVYKAVALVRENWYGFRPIAMGLAPRTRLRAILRLLSIENRWTRAYDAHVARARELAMAAAAVRMGRLALSNAASQPASDADMRTPVLSGAEAIGVRFASGVSPERQENPDRPTAENAATEPLGTVGGSLRAP
jgi:hypothetical protein